MPIKDPARIKALKHLRLRRHGPLTAEKLRELLAYDANTGHFTWLQPRPHGVKVGDQAGRINTQGYVQFAVLGRLYSAHRVVWLYVFGEWPPSYIDHINGVRSDNRLANLRLATNSQNQANRRRWPKNTSGMKGVCWNKKSNAWQAGIKVNGRSIHLGLHPTREAASAAYAQAASQYFGEFSTPA